MTFGEFLTELNARIAAAKVAGLWTDTQKKAWINTAIQRVCDFRPWKFLELAKTTTTKEDQEYYDEPTDFKTNSIYYMEVDGEEYVKKNWERYQEYKAAESTEKIFAAHNGFYFINPTPTEAGKTVDIYGIRIATKLVNDNDRPITPSEFDESIIKLALVTCLQKERRYGEAAAERVEVEAPKNPRVEGSGGLLAKLAEREEDESVKGYVGRARSSRHL